MKLKLSQSISFILAVVQGLGEVSISDIEFLYIA